MLEWLPLDVFSADWIRQNFHALWQIIVIDIVLAGDNALVVGLAASRVRPEIRTKVIFWGIAGAVVLRILFAIITNQLLGIVGILVFGGVLLLVVCWTMFQQIRTDHAATAMQNIDTSLGDPSAVSVGVGVGFWSAVTSIIIADVSMSLDNVLAVAGAAKGDTFVLVLGLAIAVVLMAIASTFIAKLLVKYPWVTWIGLLIILYIALDMIYRGSGDVACYLESIDRNTCPGLWQMLVEAARR